MLSYILPFLVLILVVVFIHEYGHYYFARRFGVGVTDFSIGFGKEIFCQNGGSISREYKLPPKNTMGVITNEGMIDICSKFLLITPIKNPNKAKVKETNTNKNIINIGYLTVTSAKKEAVA